MFLSLYKCEICGCSKLKIPFIKKYDGFFDCHHLNYRRFGKEKIWGKNRDLMILCRKCHSSNPPYN